MKITTLFENKWLSFREMVDKNNGIHGYSFIHEIRCEGKIVSILPYRKNGGKVEYLFRSEFTPCWSLTESKISSITGGCDHGTPLESALIELKEEAGYSKKAEDMVFLGNCHGTKSADTVYFLYTVDLTNDKMGEATGDGSELETKSHCYWTNADEIVKADDPLLPTSFVRIQKHLGLV